MSQVLYFDTSEISVWPSLRSCGSSCSKAGKPMGDFDLLIAATAQAYQMAVATADCGFDNLGERVPIERWDAVQPAADPT
jgi:predicted nucleic acid-binding protein